LRFDKCEGNEGFRPPRALIDRPQMFIQPHLRIALLWELGYQELRTLQQARAADARKRTWWATAVAAVIILGIAGGWFLWPRTGGVAPNGRYPNRRAAQR
jgi:hypothetical protein